MSNVSSSRAVTRLSVQVLVFSMLILMLSSLLSRGWLFAAGLLPAWQLLLLLLLWLLLLLLLLPPCCWPRWWWGERTDSVLLVCKLTPVVALPFTSRRLGARRPPPPPPPPPALVTERPPPPPPSPSLKNNRSILPSDKLSDDYFHLLCQLFPTFLRKIARKAACDRESQKDGIGVKEIPSRNSLPFGYIFV